MNKRENANHVIAGQNIIHPRENRGIKNKVYGY